ncbi:MAG: hypothetical protein WC641_05535 [Patescibacteria group bacterium]
MPTNPFEIHKTKIAPEPVEGLPYASGIRRQDLPTNVRKYADNLAAQIKEVYAKYGAKNFEELKENKKLSARDARKVADLLKVFKDVVEKKGSVTLHDIPNFDTLPSPDSFNDKQTGFKFEYIWEDEYRAGRPMSDFALTDKDLRDVGFDDQKKRTELLQEIAQAKEHEEQEEEATVFDIGDAIAQKQQENPDHPNFLTTKEVFEAIDAAGYRSATLEELLAFGQQHWNPEADPKTLTDEEKLLQRINVPCIYTLASVFSRSDDRRINPLIRFVLRPHGGERDLRASSLGRVWFQQDDHFLVIRKSLQGKTDQAA